MNYSLILTPRAVKELDNLKRSGQKKLVSKVADLMDELIIDPRAGTGKPERLKHYSDGEMWSRRLDKKNRMVYEIRDSEIIVLVLSVTGHYDDK